MYTFIYFSQQIFTNQLKFELSSSSLYSHQCMFKYKKILVSQQLFSQGNSVIIASPNTFTRVKRMILKRKIDKLIVYNNRMINRDK